jgi:hypothetical protein
VSRLAAAFTVVPWASRPVSRSFRTYPSMPGAVARLIAGIAAAALLVTTHASNRVRRDASVHAFSSVSATAALPALHTALSHRVVPEQRSATRWPTGPDSALPQYAHASLGRVPAHGVSVREPASASAPLVARGYDATAPPVMD